MDEHDDDIRPFKQAWSSALTHAAGFFALGAFALSSLGVVTTMGRINASDLDLAQAFGRIPLEQHLRNGIAYLGETSTQVFFVGYALLFLTLVLLPVQRPRSGASSAAEDERDAASQDGDDGGRAADQATQARAAQAREPEPDDTGEKSTNEPGFLARQRSRLERWARRALAALPLVWAVVVVGTFSAAMLFIVLTQPWPIGVAAVLASALIAYSGVLIRRFRGQTRRWGLVYVSTLLALTVVIGLPDAYYRADPLPTARVTIGSDGLFSRARTERAALIAVDAGVLYTGPTAADASCSGKHSS